MNSVHRVRVRIHSRTRNGIQRQATVAPYSTRRTKNSRTQSTTTNANRPTHTNHRTTSVHKQNTGGHTVGHATPNRAPVGYSKGTIALPPVLLYLFCTSVAPPLYLF